MLGEGTEAEHCERRRALGNDRFVRSFLDGAAAAGPVCMGLGSSPRVCLGFSLVTWMKKLKNLKKSAAVFFFASLGSGSVVRAAPGPTRPASVGRARQALRGAGREV